MWQAVLVGVIAGLVSYSTQEDPFISDGVWIVNNLVKCDDPEQYPFEFELTKRKINRTHDGFSLKGQLTEDITANGFGVFMETFTKCDGGYKFSQNLADDSLCGLLNRYVQSDLEKMLALAGVDPPNCPIPKGQIEFNDFVIDYTQLPKQAKVGEHKAIIYIVKQFEKMACIILYATFKAEDDDEGDDYE